jgi:DAK2 domain fusion protein YloV
MSAPGAPRSGETAEHVSAVDGDSLARAFRAGADSLTANAGAIDAINVFPVPDGDTGTNMASTMRAAVGEVALVSNGASARDVAAAASRGALIGAKGNSGVILSQILHGFAALSDDEPLDADALAFAFERAREAAYRVVSEPKEGTILTAIAAAANAASTHGEDLDECFAAAVEAARAAVARTPELLPVLKEAGVVDSGAQGLYVLLDGMLRGLRRQDLAPAEDLGSVDSAYLEATSAFHGSGGSGFCTEFVIEAPKIDAPALRGELQSMGESVLVVGDGDLVRVHIHASEPAAVLAYGRTIGVVSREKVDDLTRQIEAAAARRQATAPLVDGIAVIAVAAGSGIERLFHSLGAAAVVRGGQTMNPSAGEIRAAIAGTSAARVVVLPNNKNVVMAARQAAESTATAEVEVIPTSSVPEGVAALVALNTEAPFADNVASMLEASHAVRSAEVTRAARATRINGIDVAAGQPIAIVDGELAVSAGSIPAAVRAAVRRMIEGHDEPLVTLYYGEGEDAGSAEVIADGLRDELGCEVETVDGDQPHYPYLIGAE